MVGPKGSLHFRKDWELGQNDQITMYDLWHQCIHAIVVLMRPTFVNKEILASSTAKAGVSTILSLSTFEHLVEWYRALT